jgi:amino acid transporter
LLAKAGNLNFLLLVYSLFGALFSLPRGVYAMAQDGLLFKFLARVNEKTQLPLVFFLIIIQSSLTAYQKKFLF